MLYEGPDGDAIVQQLGEDKAPSKTIDWEAELSRHKLATVSLRLHPTTARLGLTCAVFVRQRVLGQSAFFSLKDIYTSLGLKSYGGCQSRWIFNTKKSWQKSFAESFGCSVFLEGSYCTEGTAHKKGLAFADRCLPFAAVSTCGLLCLCLRFSCLRREAGGFAELAHREGAEAIARNLFRCLDAEEFSIQFTMAKGYRWEWPRPRPSLDGRTTLSVPVRRGRVDLESVIVASARPDRSAVCHAFWKDLSKALRVKGLDPRSVGLAELMKILVGESKWKHVFGQMLTGVAMRLERVLGASVQRRVRHDACDQVRMSWVDFESEVTSYARDQQLASYVEACQHATLGRFEFTCATDKANVRAVPLQTTVIGIGPNTVFMPPPGVRRERLGGR